MRILFGGSCYEDLVMEDLVYEDLVIEDSCYGGFCLCRILL